MNEIRKQLGPMADPYIQKIKALAPEFAWVNVTFPFGELYPRDVLDLKTRELCTVAALTVQGFPFPSSHATHGGAVQMRRQLAEQVCVPWQWLLPARSRPGAHRGRGRDGRG